MIIQLALLNYDNDWIVNDMVITIHYLLYQSKLLHINDHMRHHLTLHPTTDNNYEHLTSPYLRYQLITLNTAIKIFLKCLL